MPTIDKLGNYLEKLIKDAGYETIEAFSKDHKIPKSTLSTILNRAYPDIKHSSLERIAKALGKKVYIEIKK